MKRVFERRLELGQGWGGRIGKRLDLRPGVAQRGDAGVRPEGLCQVRGGVGRERAPIVSQLLSLLRWKRPGELLHRAGELGGTLSRVEIPALKERSNSTHRRLLQGRIWRALQPDRADSPPEVRWT